MSKTYKHLCTTCGDDVTHARWSAGYHLCLLCGEYQAKQRKFTIVPMHKSNYIACFNREDLIGINNKGGLVK
jgi:ribosomal protein L37AE/L43A